jgi:hypothetical protein
VIPTNGACVTPACARDHSFAAGPYWRGFLASTLTAKDLLLFALVTFFLADFNIKAKLIQHLLTDPAGGYLIDGYKALYLPGAAEEKTPEA